MNKLFSNIKGDSFGGITAGIVALPLALAFGVSSGLRPSAGLYGTILISFFAALFGGTNTQISGPSKNCCNSSKSNAIYGSNRVVCNGRCSSRLKIKRDQCCAGWRARTAAVYDGAH